MNSTAAYNQVLARVDTKRGAPMGRVSNDIKEKPTDRRVFDRAVPLNEGYDAGAAYWGWPNNLRVEYTADLKYIRFYRTY